MEENKEKLDLAFAYVTQQDVSNNSDWLIQKNITEETLGSFNGKINDTDMRQILKFAQKFELKAFNTGINFEKQKSIKLIKDMTDSCEARLKTMREENERLSLKLMQLIGDPDDIK